jgi:hypothetical protein
MGPLMRNARLTSDAAFTFPGKLMPGFSPYSLTVSAFTVLTVAPPVFRCVQADADSVRPASIINKCFISV